VADLAVAARQPAVAVWQLEAAVRQQPEAAMPAVLVAERTAAS
jgi:hypothetical protein